MQRGMLTILVCGLSDRRGQPCMLGRRCLEVFVRAERGEIDRIAVVRIDILITGNPVVRLRGRSTRFVRTRCSAGRSLLVGCIWILTGSWHLEHGVVGKIHVRLSRQHPVEEFTGRICRRLHNVRFWPLCQLIARRVPKFFHRLVLRFGSNEILEVGREVVEGVHRIHLRVLGPTVRRRWMNDPQSRRYSGTDGRWAIQAIHVGDWVWRRIVRCQIGAWRALSIDVEDIDLSLLSR